MNAQHVLVRPPAVAGFFYPSDPDELAESINACFADAVRPARARRSRRRWSCRTRDTSTPARSPHRATSGSPPSPRRCGGWCCSAPVG
jgi:hypothetical protein